MSARKPNHLPARGRSWPDSHLRGVRTIEPGDRIVVWRNPWGVLHPITHETEALLRREAIEATVTSVERVTGPGSPSRLYAKITTTEGQTIPLPVKHPVLVLPPAATAMSDLDGSVA